MKADQSKITLHAKMENIYWSNKSMIERVIIVSWLIKDMSWMATIVVLGYFFGVLSIFLHLFLLVCDNRVAMRFHHASLFLWVVGNFFWMTLEFTSSAPSSHVHIGLDTPTGGITNSTERFLVYAKHWLFLTSVTIQIALYIFLFNGRVNIPGDDPEPPLSEKDCQRTVVGTGMNKTEPGDDDVTTIQFQNSAHHSPNTRELKRNNQKNYARLDIHQDMDVEESANPSGGVSGDGTLESERIGGWSMVLIENFYVIFWIGKDLFWSWSTGDFGIPIFETMICETFAITFGTLACCSFLYVGFLYRHNLEYFLDSVTSVCWLLANFVWVSTAFLPCDNSFNITISFIMFVLMLHGAFVYYVC